MYRKLICISFIFGFLATYFIHTIRAASSVSVTIDTHLPTLAMGEERTIDIHAAGGENMGAYEFNFTYNPAVLQVNSVSDGLFLGSTGRSVVTLDPPVIDNAGGSVSFGAFTFGAQSGPSGEGTLARITLKGVDYGDSDILLKSISVTDTDGTAIPVNVIPSSLVVPTLSPTPTSSPSVTITPPLLPTVTPEPSVTPTYVPSSTPTVTSTPTPSLTPTSTPTVTPVSSQTPTPPSSVTPTATVTPTGGISHASLTLVQESASVAGTDFHVSVNLNTESPIAGTDAVILYDVSELTLVSATPLELLYHTFPASVDLSKGIIRISQVSDIGSPYMGSGKLADLVFTPKSVGVATIGLDYGEGRTNESNVIENSTGNDILEMPSSLKVSILSKPQLRIKLVTPFQEAVSNSIKITQSDTWTKTIIIPEDGISPLMDLDGNWLDADVKFTLKLPGFLKKEFTVNVQPGINDVTVDGLLGGDLNDDGMVNTVDLGIMYTNWFTDAAGDLNRDHIVNTADYWMLANNYLKEDE